MIDEDKVIKYLSKGLGTTAIANAVGCDPSYISQLREREDIKQKVAAISADYEVADATFDENIESAEETALARIQRALPMANLQQAMSAFRILNTARRRKDGPVQPVQVNVNVTLELPAAALPRYVTNAQSEIVEVDGRTLVSAAPQQLHAMLELKTGRTLQPAITDDSKATARLDSLTPVGRNPRRLPSVLTPDMI